MTVTLDGVANDGAAGEGDQVGVLVAGVVDVEKILGGAADDTLNGNDGKRSSAPPATTR